MAKGKRKNPSLVNVSRKKVVASKVRYAKTFFQKFRGLMFRKKSDYALVFPSHFPGRANLAIHMFFVFFPIDVVYLRKNRVVDIRKRVMPFTPFIVPNADSDTLLELPVGSINRGAIHTGDVIKVLN